MRSNSACFLNYTYFLQDMKSSRRRRSSKRSSEVESEEFDSQGSDSDQEHLTSSRTESSSQLDSRRNKTHSKIPTYYYSTLMGFVIDKRFHMLISITNKNSLSYIYIHVRYFTIDIYFFKLCKNFRIKV